MIRGHFLFSGFPERKFHDCGKLLQVDCAMLKKCLMERGFP